MKIELKQWEQDIIYACKGRYVEQKEEPTLNGLKRVVGNIIGQYQETVELYAVNHWLCKVYHKLLQTEGTMVGKGALNEYIIGQAFTHRHYSSRSPQEHAYYFFISEIGGCRAHGKDYELVLNFNPDIMTDEDKIELASRAYKTVYGKETTGSNKVSIVSSDKVIETYDSPSFVENIDLARRHIEMLARHELGLQ